MAYPFTDQHLLLSMHYSVTARDAWKDGEYPSQWVSPVDTSLFNTYTRLAALSIIHHNHPLLYRALHGISVMNYCHMTSTSKWDHQHNICAWSMWGYVHVMGLQTAAHQVLLRSWRLHSQVTYILKQLHNNLDGWEYHLLLCFHGWPVKKPKITSVALWHKKGGCSYIHTFTSDGNILK